MLLAAAAAAFDPGHRALEGADSCPPKDRPPHFLLLGPLSISAGETLEVLQPSKPATLLAMLLMHPDTVVSVEALLRAVWDDEPPGTAKAALHTCVLRLRRLFAKYGVSGGDIEAVPGGYRIAARAETLDLIRFRELARQARTEPDPEAELSLLRGALTLWRGAALTNVHSQVLHREEVPRLVEERLRVVERVFDLEIALDRRREVLPELLTAARAHPTHEHFWEQLIEALYRTGRRAEALSEYRRVKEYLREQLGVDPGPALQRLELTVLRGEDVGADGRDGGWRGSVRRDSPAVRESVTVRGTPSREPAGRPVGPVSGSQVLDRLQNAGLLSKLPEGYEMHELLYVLTRDAAVVDRGRTGEPTTPGAPAAPGGPATPAEAGALLPGKDDVV
jgi:DNA-binding SARP family transcriptional activator